jgi:hypothetical protein
MPFITRFKHEPYVRDMIRKGLAAFIDTHVLCYRDSRNIQTHFVGSVAHFHEDTLREVAAERGVHVGRIVHRPIEGLYAYHIKHYFQKIPF